MDSPAVRLQQTVQAAMKAGEKFRVGVLRMLLAAVKQKQIDGGQTLDEAGLVAVAQKLIKQRRESATQFRRAGREELAVREEQEIVLLEPFLPPAADAETVAAAIEAALVATRAASLKDMGKVIAHVKAALSGADLGQVSKLVKQKLTK